MVADRVVEQRRFGEMDYVEKSTMASHDLPGLIRVKTYPLFPKNIGKSLFLPFVAIL